MTILRGELFIIPDEVYLRLEGRDMLVALGFDG